LNPLLLTAALSLRKAEILAFPASSTAKHPDRGLWFHDADGYKPRWTRKYYPPDGWPTVEQTRRMFARDDVARLFIITGARSGNLVCFDFDAPEICDLWSDRVPRSILDKCYIERSQRSGGRHVAFRVAEPVPFTVPARTADGRVCIEVRSEGQGFCAAPGVGYVRFHGDLCAVPILTGAEYCTFVEAAAAFNAYEPPPIAALSPEWQATDGSDRPGDRFNRAHGQREVLDMLTHHGWRIVRQRGATVDVLRPGDSTAAYSGSVNADGVLIVFSTATPFAASAAGAARPYSPFAVYAVLEHGGDFRAACRVLYRRFSALPRPRRDWSLTPRTFEETEIRKWLG
jgi:hypothetical protein